MSAKVFALILISVSMSAVAQIALKTGMSTPNVGSALATGDRGSELVAAAFSPMVWLGLGLYGLGAVLWLFVLARVDVSAAYPFVGLGFILTMGLGAFFLGEQIGGLRLVGTVLVSVGVYLVAQST